jgi:hypothetical protein
VLSKSDIVLAIVVPGDIAGLTGHASGPGDRGSHLRVYGQRRAQRGDSETQKTLHTASSAAAGTAAARTAAKSLTRVEACILEEEWILRTGR